MEDGRLGIMNSELLGVLSEDNECRLYAEKDDAYKDRMKLVRKIKNAGQTIRVVGRLTKPPRRAASTMWTSQRKALARKAFAKSGLGSHGSFDEQETQDATGATPQALEKSAKHGVAGSVGQTDQTSLSEEKAAWHTSVVREYTVDPH